MSQEPYVFFDTIEKNINLSDKASEEEIERAVHQSEAEAFIE